MTEQIELLSQIAKAQEEQIQVLKSTIAVLEHLVYEINYAVKEMGETDAKN